MSRLVLVTVPTGKREAVQELLESEELTYAFSDETGSREYAAIAYVPLPTNAVEPTLQRLRDVGIDDDVLTVIVDAQTVLSREFNALEEEYADEEVSSRIAGEELKAAVENLIPTRTVFAAMMVVSAIIATAGVLLDSAAVVVGSMVIAPFIGPAMGASVGTVFRDREMFLQGVKLQVGGVSVAVAAATVFAFGVKEGHLVPPGLDVLAIQQVRERLRPDVLSLVVALGAGIAGVLSLATGISSALVGVMIAAALVPPAATVGIGIAWGLPSVVLGSGVLLAVNVLSINLAALALLWYLGYRPGKWFVRETRTATFKRIGLLLAAILVLTAFLGSVTYTTFRAATTEEAVREDVQAVLSQPPYEEFSLLEVSFEYAEVLPTRIVQRPSDVTVTVGVPPGRTPESLAGSIDDRVDRTVGRDVAVHVRYITVESP